MTNAGLWLYMLCGLLRSVLESIRIDGKGQGHGRGKGLQYFLQYGPRAGGFWDV